MELCEDQRNPHHRRNRLRRLADHGFWSILTESAINILVAGRAWCGRGSTRRLPPARQPVSGACPDIRRSNRPCATRISTVSVFPASTFLRTLTPIEPPWYGPVCPVVWEGRRREASPYPDPCPIPAIDGCQSKTPRRVQRPAAARGGSAPVPRRVPRAALGGRGSCHERITLS